MSRQNETLRRPLVRRDRVILACLGCGALALLAIAASLRPDARGYGTHERLGLPPCTFMTMLHFRCPSCGMTTSWSRLLHGQPGEALRSSASGTLLAGVALVGGVMLLGSAFTGRWWLPRESIMVTGSLSLVAVILVEWWIRLALG